jgi:transcriptional regulator with XRE-family HTH domain
MARPNSRRSRPRASAERSLGEYLRKARLEKRATLAQVSSDLILSGIPCCPQHLSDVERDYRLPSEELLNKLCERYGLDLDYALYLIGRLPERIVAAGLSPKEVAEMYGDRGNVRTGPISFVPPDQWRHHAADAD